MSVLATDAFNRSTGLGANWTAVPGLTGPFTIVSNLYAAGVPGQNSSGCYWNAASFPADQYAQGTIILQASGGGPIVRVNASTGEHYEVIVDNPGASATIALYRFAPGPSWTLLGSTTSATTVGDVLRLEVQGSTLTAFLNGVVKVTGSDGTLTSGAAGLYFYSGQSLYLDDFEAGDLAAAPTGRANFLTLLGVS
jgi:hypothetical protein